MIWPAAPSKAVPEPPPELRDAMTYVMQFEAHENVYEYKRLVLRLFEGS